MKWFRGYICIRKHQYALLDRMQPSGDSMHLQNQLWIRLCVKPHYPAGKDENSFLKHMKSAIIFQSNWKDEATTTFHNKPGSQKPNTTAKISTPKTDEIRLLNFGSGNKAAAKSSQKTALRTSLYIVELSATFLLHHLSSTLWLLCLVLVL